MKSSDEARRLWLFAELDARAYAEVCHRLSSNTGANDVTASHGTVAQEEQKSGAVI